MQTKPMGFTDTGAKHREAPDKRTYRSLCQACCCAFHPDMLTGYCITSEKCEWCGRLSDLAMTVDKLGV